MHCSIIVTPGSRHWILEFGLGLQVPICDQCTLQTWACDVSDYVVHDCAIDGQKCGMLRVIQGDNPSRYQTEPKRKRERATRIHSQHHMAAKPLVAGDQPQWRWPRQPINSLESPLFL